MKIAVCSKQAIDTEALITLEGDSQVVTEGAALIIDPYAEFAVEKAVQLKEEHGGEVIIVTVGSQEELPAIRHALSMGADRAILVDDKAIDSENPQAKARVLAKVLERESPDLIMGGYKSGDTARAQTIPRLAAIMALPEVGLVTDIRVVDGGIVAAHEIDDGVEEVQVPLPAVLSAQQGLAEPRYPNVRDIMQSKKKPVESLTLADLETSASEVDSSIAQTKVISYSLKPQREGGSIIEGDPDEAVARTTKLLVEEAKVL